MEPTQELVDEIYREKVLRARRLSIARRTEIGAELSDLAIQMMREAIEHQMPGATPRQIKEEVQRRIELRRRLDNTPLPDERETA